MKIKMWCLVNTKEDHIIQVGTGSNVYAVGFATRKGLLDLIGYVEKDVEEIRKVEIEN